MISIRTSTKESIGYGFSIAWCQQSPIKANRLKKCHPSPRRSTHFMKQSLPIVAIALGSLLAGGCATKKYVGQSIAPVNGRVDQLSQQSNQQGQKIDQT